MTARPSGLAAPVTKIRMPYARCLRMSLLCGTSRERRAFWPNGGPGLGPGPPFVTFRAAYFVAGWLSAFAAVESPGVFPAPFGKSEMLAGKRWRSGLTVLPFTHTS